MIERELSIYGVSNTFFLVHFFITKNFKKFIIEQITDGDGGLRDIFVSQIEYEYYTDELNGKW